MRIELRQIGAREEARLIGGLGPCGRDLCCSTFQGNQDPVSIRMAKEQNLPLNPMKISGLCGRLMCCLKYEHDQYVCFRKEAPNRGTRVATDQGEGVVIGFQAAKESVTLRMGDGSILDVPLRRCSCDGEPCAPLREGEEPVLPIEPVAPAPVAATSGNGGGFPDTEKSRGGGRRDQEDRPPSASPSARSESTAPAKPAVEAGGAAGEEGTSAEGGESSGASEGRPRAGRSRRRRRRSRRPSGGGQGGGQTGGGQSGGQGA